MYWSLCRVVYCDTTHFDSRLTRQADCFMLDILSCTSLGRDTNTPYVLISCWLDSLWWTSFKGNIILWQYSNWHDATGILWPCAWVQAMTEWQYSQLFCVTESWGMSRPRGNLANCTRLYSVIKGASFPTHVLIFNLQYPEYVFECKSSPY